MNDVVVVIVGSILCVFTLRQNFTLFLSLLPLSTNSFHVVEVPKYIIMGGLCAAAGVPSLPEINIDNEHLNELIKTAIDEIPDKVNENCRNFPNQIVVADPDPFQVPDTNLKLTKDSTDKEITMAAIVAAFATQARDAIKVNYIYLSNIIYDIYIYIYIYI